MLKELTTPPPPFTLTDTPPGTQVAAGPQASIDELVRLIYHGPLEARPWESFATCLRTMLDALALTIVLQPSDTEHTEIHVLAPAPDHHIDWQALNEHYIRRYMDSDPTAPDKVAPGQLVNMADFRDSAYFREFLQPQGIEHALRMAFAEPGGMRCWLAAAKTAEQDPFSAADLELLRHLLPHLEQALELYANIMLSRSEQFLYQDAIEQLAFGSVLLDGSGTIISANPIARNIAGRHPALRMDGEQLRLAKRSADAELQRAVAAAIDSRSRPNGGRYVELVRMECADGNIVGLLIRPAPHQPYYHGRHTPHVMVYISDLQQHIDSWEDPQGEPQQLIAKLFRLTPTEAKLALLLADGKTLAEAAASMQIAEKTARNHSKNIYEKTGIKRQVDLVRLIYKSVALLG